MHLSTQCKAAVGVALAAASALLLSACSSSGSPQSGGGGSSAASFSESSSAACAAGATEGAVDYWSTTDPDYFAKEIAPFTKENPDITVTYTNIQPTDATQRLITEAQAKHALSADAMTMDLASASPLFQAKLVQDVDYAKLGIPSNLIQTTSGVKIYRVFRDLIGIAYNPKITKPADLPTTWDQLLDSKWQGKVIVDPRGVYVGGLAAAWGEQKTEDWFTGFLTTAKPQVVKGATASLQEIASGQALLSTSAAASAVLQAQKSGAPVDITYLDAITSQDKYAMLVKGAQHPQAAQCFLAWWGSSEGQAQQLAVEYKANQDKPDTVPACAKLGFVTTAKEQDTVDTTTAVLAQDMAQ